MSVKFTILGCGSSLGVPRADGYWGECNPKEKKNYRTRCSAVIRTKNTNTLIDTSPDLRFQLIDNKINNIDRILYTHYHADQTHGINDLRVFYIKQKKKIPVYADYHTTKYLKNHFSYCFTKKSFGYPPILQLKKVKKKLIFRDKNTLLNIKTIPVKHGAIHCNTYIINNKCAYASDVNFIYNKDIKNFISLNYLVIDCLRIDKHPSHYNLEDVLKLINILKPKKSILTNLHADLDYNYLINILPKNVIPAYDGMSFYI